MQPYNNKSVKQKIKEYDELLASYKELYNIELISLLSAGTTSTAGPTSTAAQATIEMFNNTNVNGGLEQYDILLKRYKELYQLELKQLLDYKDITVKIPIKPLTMKLTLTSQWTDEQFKNAIATAVTPKVNPSQIIIISNNTPGIIEFTVMQKN